MFNRHIYRRWLKCAITGGDLMIFQRMSTEENFGTFKLENSIEVSLDSLVVPGENWANSEVLEAATASLLSHLL